MKHLIPLFIILLLLPSCSPAPNDFSAGRPITKDELASLSAELFTEVPEPDTEAPTEETAVRDPNRVYWVEGGSVYHFDRDCAHIRDAEDVIEGTYRTAEWSYGIGKACSSCGG